MTFARLAIVDKLSHSPGEGDPPAFDSTFPIS